MGKSYTHLSLEERCLLQTQLETESARRLTRGERLSTMGKMEAS